MVWGVLSRNRFSHTLTKHNALSASEGGDRSGDNLHVYGLDDDVEF